MAAVFMPDDVCGCTSLWSYPSPVQVHGLWTPVEGRFKNYIRNPKANGYRSLHTVITASDGQPMEIQVEPCSMAAMSSLWDAAH